MAGQDGAGRKRRRLLSAEQKFELWLQLLREEGSQREIADRWDVDRSVVMKVRKLAKEGALVALAASRPGRRRHDPKDERIADLEAEIDRLVEAVKELSIENVLLRGKSRGGW